MKITKLPNGNLQLELERGDKTPIRSLIAGCRSELEAEAEFIDGWLAPHGYAQTTPFAVGALTDAPIICDSSDPADPQPGDEAWGYMDYAVSFFLDRLLEGRPVIWQSGGKLELKETAPDSVWAAVEAAGIKHAHHETDLYLPDTEEVRAILEKFPVNKANARPFTNQVEGGTWLDIPFAYLPAWEAKQKCHAQ